MKNIFLLAAGILTVTLLTSCQKVIHVNLNDSAPRFVIEANLSDDGKPGTVKITRSKNFDENNDFPAVTGAFITLTDSTTGQTDTLAADVNGIYRTPLLTGVRGHTYQLYIKVDNNIFTASSYLPQQAIDLDTLYVKKQAWGGTEFLYPSITYSDPAGQGNYYRMVVFKNNVAYKDIFLQSDRFKDGQRMEADLYINEDEEADNIHTGDSVKVELRCINEPVYKYYSSLDETMGQYSATPANPQSNIQGGALGYFSTHTVRSRSVQAR